MNEVNTSRYLHWRATGKTYPHREWLQRWGWYYMGHELADKSTWGADHIEDENDGALLAIAELPRITVKSYSNAEQTTKGTT